jgi:hypothetical protein
LETEGSTSFLKKEAKNFYLQWVFARHVPQPAANKSFFASFFAKKEALSCIRWNA